MRSSLAWWKAKERLYRNRTRKHQPHRTFLARSGQAAEHRDSENATEQKFAVSLRAQNWRLDNIRAHALEIQQRRFPFFTRRQLSRLVAHNPSLGHEFPSRLELRFNQDDHLPAAALFE